MGESDHDLMRRARLGESVTFETLVDDRSARCAASWLGRRATTGKWRTRPKLP